MNLSEILLLLFGIALPFYLSTSSAQNNRKWVIAFIAVLLLLHAAIYGLRWQMTPIYLLYVWLLFSSFRAKIFFRGNGVRKFFTGFGWLLLLGLGGILAHVLPVFQLPTPQGKYAVGSRSFHLVSEQEETITPITDDKRELMLKIWYPAQLKEDKKEVYLSEGDRVGFAKKYGLPEGTFNYLNQVETHTYQESPIASATFPVLIFSHGYNSQASAYYALLEEIVSQGYIVININHTYESVGAVFPNGDIKLYNLEYDRKYNNQEMAEMAWNAMEAYKKAQNEQEELEGVEYVLRNYIAAAITQRWSKDIQLVVDQLQEWNTSSFLANHLDLNKVGVFGHSQGGAAAGQALLDIPILKAGINLDGTQWGNMVDTSLSKPFISLYSDWVEGHPDFNKHAYRNGSTSDFYQAKIKGSGHSSFMDIPLMINLSYLNEAGNIEPKRATQITTQLVVQFFDRYLKGKNADLLELSAQFPELEISVD